MEKKAFNMAFVTNIQLIDEYIATEKDKDLPFGYSSSKAHIDFYHLRDIIATMEFKSQAEAENVFNHYVDKFNLQVY